jgi:hypothetical protein
MMSAPSQVGPAIATGPVSAAVMRRGDAVLDRLALGLRQSAEAADVEIHPAHRIVRSRRLTSTTSALHHAGVADDEAAGLDHHLRQRVAEMLGHRAHDRVAEAVDLRHLVA